MKKMIMLLMLLVSLATVNAQCDWSSLKLQQFPNRNYYRWYVSGRALDDTCVDWMFMVYNVQTKKTDTVCYNEGICDVQFNKKGKYKMYLKVWNRCLKCDTTMMREVNLIYFPKCSFVYGLRSSTGIGCADSMVGEMTLGPWTKGDTCWQWYSYIWNGPMLDKLSQHDWDSMSTDQLYMYYDFNDRDLVWQKGPGNDARRIALKFPHDGHYLIATQWYNKCLDQDTFFFTRITIETCNNTGIPSIGKNSVAVSPNPANDRVLVCLTTPAKNPLCVYHLYDVSGKVVMSGSISNCTQLNVSNLMNGIYTFKTGNLTQKIVISH